MKFAIVLVALLGFCAAEKVRFDNYRVYKLTINDEEQLRAVQQLEDQDRGYTFWDFPAAVGQEVDIVVPPHKFADIQEFSAAYGTPIEVKINNVQELFDQENPLVTPRSFGWTAYYRTADIYEWLDHILEEFPGVTSGFVAGQSYEGRQIRGMKISYKEGNKGIVIEAHIHAREWISSATATYVINELLRSNDPEVRDIAENTDWYIIPVTNPDGLEYTKDVNRMWRKTRRPNSGSTCVGTDPNRNYAYNWMQGGASTNPCSETYAGPQAFSESETRTTTEWVYNNIQDLRVYVSFHSYGQYILSPWGHTTTSAPNYNHLREIMEASRTRIAAVYGTQYTIGSTAATLYVASGTSHDHFYGQQDNNIQIAYTFEFRDRGQYGFALPASQIIPNSIETVQGLIGFLADIKCEMKVFGVLLVISLLGGNWAEKVKFNDYKVFTVQPETEDQLKALRSLEHDSVASFDFWTSAKNVGQKSDIMVAPGQMDEFRTFLEENHLEASTY
uniref:Zinc carboxypeptidase A 1 n=1 Tax=Phlebotomus papatasi TaxID=29031 RepID=A0A1B0CZA8_PHLPP